MGARDDDEIDVDVEVSAQDPFAPPPDAGPSIALVDPPMPSLRPQPSASAEMPSAPPPARLSTSARPPSAAPPRPTSGRVEVIASGRAPLSPMARLAIGVVLGLGLGWIGSMPYARRAEREIAGLRDQANAIRYREDPELRARTALLDADAEAHSARAAWVTGGLWLAIAGLGAGAWLRFTRPAG